MIAVFFIFIFFSKTVKRYFMAYSSHPPYLLAPLSSFCIPSLSFSSFPFLVLFPCYSFLVVIISKENHLAPPPSPPHTAKVVSWSFLLLLPLFHQKKTGEKLFIWGLGVVPHPVWFLSCVFLKQHQACFVDLLKASLSPIK